MKKWMVVCGNYCGLEEKAVDLITAKMREYLDYEIPVYTANAVSYELLEGRNVVNVGTLSDNGIIKARYSSIAGGSEEGYVIEVTATEEDNAIFIGGNTAKGVYYGVVSFLAEYLPQALPSTVNNINVNGLFKMPFNRVMHEFFKESAPAIKNRAVWTWGHCIFDYKKFLDNMSLIKLNEIVIWNDKMPINAKEVVDYAHEDGIKVIFGFAWGWDTDCKAFDINDCFNADKIKTFALDVINYYENNVLPTGADGIYFQSFTELGQDNIDGVNIAEAVTSWVNGIAKEIFAKYPALEIQFGLHASSVRKHINHLSKVDERIKIVWEDCGSFPYDYAFNRLSDFDATQKFTEEITSLRGEKERFGAVLKGMTTLYWDKFKHIDEPFVLGKASQRLIDEVYADRLPTWKYAQAEWMKNAEYAKIITKTIAERTRGQTDVQLLVEYGAFEKEIYFPVALAAELMWEPFADVSDIIEKVALNPAVKFVDL